MNRQPYPDPLDPSIYHLPLSGGYAAIIDAADAPRVARHRWVATNARPDLPGTRYIYARTLGDGRRYLHRFITRVRIREVDHINGNTLDCRRANLRPCTHRQNLRALVKRVRGTTSRFRGVSWYRNYARWVVKLTRGTRSIFIGYYDDELAAARAFDAAARRFYGKSASFNFPRPGERSALPASHRPQPELA
jgi:hypothetical protein